MQSILLKLRSWWETADRTQKTVTIFGSVFLVLLIGGTVYFAGKPKMDVLFRNLSAQDQGTIANELTKMGVPFEQDRSGTIMVPANKIPEVQGKLAVAQKLPSSGSAGNADLDKLGIMNTPTAEREKIRAILEGELAQSIAEIAGVASARVHITNPRSSAFVREDEASTTSVFVKETTEGAVGPAQARAIQRLVQFAVPGLTARNINVVSNDGRVLIDGKQSETGTGAASERMNAEIMESKRRETMLQSRMDAVFGKGNTVVSVPVLELNYDQKQQQSTERVPTKASEIETMSETMGAATMSGGGGTAGTPANTPENGSLSNSSDNKNYTGLQENKKFEVSETSTTTTYATGNLKRMAINVLVNSSVVKSEAAVKNMVKGELGPLAADAANFGYNVTSVEFDTKSTEDIKKSEAAAKGAATQQQVLSILPIAALLFVGFMVVKAIAKASKASNVLVAVSPDGQMVPLSSSDMRVLIDQNGQQIEVAANSSQALEAARSGKIMGTTSGPVIKGGDGAILDDGSLEDKQNALTEFVGASETIRIAKIPDHINIPLEQIKNLAIERPDTVAMLLKSWFLAEK